MNSKTFRKHYINLLRKIKFLEQAKDNLEYAGEKVFDTESYFEKLGVYKNQIDKYHRLQNVLLESYSTQIQQTRRK